MKNFEKFYQAIDTTTDDSSVSCAIRSFIFAQGGKRCLDYAKCEDCRRECYEWACSDYVEKSKITRFEKQILLNLEGNFRYMARDKNGDLFVYYGLPSRDRINWKSISRTEGLKPFNELFDMVQWEDEYPKSIEDLLKLEVISYE